MTARPAEPPSPSGALAALLAEHRPSDPAEAADLERAQALLRAASGEGEGADGAPREGADTPSPWDRDTPLHFTASAVIVHPATGRVLLRHHERQGTWLHVGGHADPGETEPLEVALREGYEETGLSDLAPWPDASLVHLVVVPVPASPREPAHEHVDLRFVLATENPGAARPERETAPVRWLSLPDAHAATGAPNLRETLHRVAELLG